MNEVELRGMRVGGWGAAFNDDDDLVITSPDGDVAIVVLEDVKGDLDDLATLIVAMAAIGDER